MGEPRDDTADDGDAGDPVIVLPPGSQEERQRQLWTLLEALEVTGWTPGDDAGPLAARIVEGLVAECPSEARTWAPGLLAIAVLAADAVRQKLRDESWAQVAALAAEWNAADATLCAAKAYGVIWNRLSDRAALDQAIHWAAFAAGLAEQTGWKAAACGYQHALLMAQRAATRDGPDDDLDRAITILRTVARQVPSDHRYQYRLASTLLTRYRTSARSDGDLDEAVTAAQRAVAVGSRDLEWRAACVHVLAGARMARWKSAARHDDDLDLALQDVLQELDEQPDSGDLLAIVIRVLRQRGQLRDLEEAARHGEHLAACLDPHSPNVSDHLRALAHLEADRFDESGDPSHLDKGISYAQRAASPLDDPARIQQRENLLAWLLAGRASTARRQPGDSAHAASLASRTEGSRIPEVALSSIRASSRVCLASDDWPGAARAADKALHLLSEVTIESGPDAIDDWLTLTQGLAATGAYGLARSGDPARAALLCERGAAMIAAHTGMSDLGSTQGEIPWQGLPVPSDSVAVHLAVTAVGSIALVTAPDTATVSINLPALTEGKVAQWTARVDQPGSGKAGRGRAGITVDTATAYIVLDEMASALAPLCSLLDATHVRLIPLGVIAGLPVSAVIEQQTGCTVSVGGSAVLHARAAAAKRTLVLPARVLAVTNPSPCSGGDALPEATREGEWLVGHGGCTVTHLDGPRATRTGVLSALDSGADLVHFGTHGNFDPDNPLRDALYLANGPDDTAEKLCPAELAGPAMVVLACCTLGNVGRRLPDEHQGFNSALLSAGAWFVLSPLWSVDDTAATSLVTAFYQHLFADNNPAAALRAARALTRERHRDQSPCWASWVLAGG